MLGPEDVVWGWRDDEPDRGTSENCAFLNQNGLGDLACTANLPYACRGPSGLWKVTAGTGVWEDGYDTCVNEYGQGYQFAVPFNAPEMLELIEEADLGSDWLWVNYHDRSVEGVWQANVEPSDIWKTPDYGGNGGEAFDDLSYLGLQRQWTSNLRRIYLRHNTRINKLGIEYNNGSIVEHGGNGGSHDQMWLGGGEFIQGVKVCTKKRDGKQRVYYLEFTTNRNNSLAGGQAIGTCTEYWFESRSLIGFYGRSNDHLQSIGFYARDQQQSGWNHGEPNGGGSENCARFGNGVLIDKACGDSYRFACRNSTGTWKVTTQTGTWDQGAGLCRSELGSNHTFAAPRTRKDAELIMSAMGGSGNVWVNYSDRENEGVWRFGR